MSLGVVSQMRFVHTVSSVICGCSSSSRNYNFFPHEPLHVSLNYDRLNNLYVQKLHLSYLRLQSGDGIANPDWFRAEEIRWRCHFVQSRRRHLRWGGGGRHVADYDWVAHFSDGTHRTRVEWRGCERASSSNVQVQIVSLCSEAGRSERERDESVKHVKFILFEILFRAEASINDALKCKAEVLRKHCVNEWIYTENTGNSF